MMNEAMTYEDRDELIDYLLGCVIDLQNRVFHLEHGDVEHGESFVKAAKIDTECPAEYKLASEGD